HLVIVARKRRIADTRLPKRPDTHPFAQPADLPCEIQRAQRRFSYIESPLAEE
ncbi:hypothetical protein FBU59_004430, partial [Linderina macrospora]